jgi:hypothetical protein
MNMVWYICVLSVSYEYSNCVIEQPLNCISFTCERSKGIQFLLWNFIDKVPSLSTVDITVFETK